mgnify:CR=1 FL=1
MAGYNLLLEDGSAILLESGSNLLLESSPTATAAPGRMTITQLAPTATITRAGLGTATASRGSGIAPTATITRAGLGTATASRGSGTMTTTRTT